MIDAPELDRALAAALKPGLGEVSVENLRELTGGASRATWAFTATTAAEVRQLILRVGPPDEIHAGMELEAAALSRAAAAGAPVPRVLAASNSPEALGNPFLVCDFVPGETIVRKIQRALDDGGRVALLEQCAEALAAPGDPLCLHNQAVIHYHRLELQAALDCAGQALRIDPSLPGAHFIRAEALLRLDHA